MKIKEKILDLTTGEESLIERELTADELSEIEKIKAEEQAKAVAQEEAKIKRQALLDKLGITEDETRLLLA